METTVPRKAKLPFKKRMQQAFEDLFLNKNGLRVPEPVNYPATLNKRSNAEVEQFNNEWACIVEYAKAYALKQYAEVKAKNARANMCEILGIDEEKLEPGIEVIYTRDNASVVLKVNNAARRLDREMLRSTLMTKYKFSSDQADECIKSSEKLGKAPVLLSPTIND